MTKIKKKYDPKMNFSALRTRGSRLKRELKWLRSVTASDLTKFFIFDQEELDCLDKVIETLEDTVE